MKEYKLIEVATYYDLTGVEKVLNEHAFRGFTLMEKLSTPTLFVMVRDNGEAGEAAATTKGAPKEVTQDRRLCPHCSAVREDPEPGFRSTFSWICSKCGKLMSAD